MTERERQILKALLHHGGGGRIDAKGVIELDVPVIVTRYLDEIVAVGIDEVELLTPDGVRIRSFGNEVNMTIHHIREVSSSTYIDDKDNP